MESERMNTTKGFSLNRPAVVSDDALQEPATIRARTVMEQLEMAKKQHYESMTVFAEYVGQQYASERDLEAAVEALTQEIHDWRMENGDLERETQILKLENDDLRKENQDVRARNHNLSAQNQDLKLKLSNSISNSEGLVESYDLLQRECEELHLQQRDSQSRYDELQSHNLVLMKSLHADPPATSVCLIDGNTAIFNEDLVSQGKTGGRKAALLLRSEIHRAFNTSSTEEPGTGHTIRRGSTLATVFMDLDGVTERLSFNGICSAATFRQFIFGFNQVPLFTLVDMGSDKDATSTKLRETLLYYSRLPQIAQTVFTRVLYDCYTLQTLQAEGLLKKTVALRGGLNNSKEDAAFLKKEILGVIEVPGLFSDRELSFPTNRKAFISLVPQIERALIVCLIDGDGAVFNEDLVAKGRSGGIQAARQLSEGIFQHVEKFQTEGHQMGPRSQQLVANIFLDAADLADSLAFNGICSTRDFEQFVLGFNQAIPLFTMVDVGSGKDEAKEKLDETLLLYSRLPQTRMVIFGGAHNDEHMPTLKTLQAEGHLRKLCILMGSKRTGPYMETFRKEVNLEAMDLPNLFVQQALAIDAEQPPGEASVPRSTERSPSEASTSGLSVRAHNMSIRTISGGSTPFQYGNTLPHNTMLPGQGVAPPQVLPQVKGAREDAGLTSSGREPIAPILADELRIDPTQLLTKQTPQLCYRHYLAPPCLKGPQCAHSHLYTLSPVQLNVFRAQVKTMPCLASQYDRRPCPKAPEACIMSHYCPDGPSCPRKAREACIFRGKNMHNPPGVATLAPASAAPSPP